MMRELGSVHTSSAVFLATQMLLGCGSSPDVDGADSGGATVLDGGLGSTSSSSGAGVGGSSNSTGGDGHGDITVGGVSTSGGRGNDARGDGTPEVCDGIDNDGDGNIDNVDVGGDGICDCLNIGTIGRIGPWSSGGDIFKDWLDTRSPLPAFEIGDEALTPEVLTGLDVIVVLRADTSPLGQDDSPAHHEFSEEEVAALAAWVEQGGGLMTTIGYQGDERAEVVNVNRLLAPFSAGYDEEKTDLDGGYLHDWNPDHAISLGVEQINVENGVQPLSDTGIVVARGDDERVGIVTHTPGQGHVIVFGDEWVTYDSEWQDTEDQQVELLWLNMIKWMSPAQECQVEIPPELVVR